MNTAYVDAIGLLAPGLISWEAGAPVLRGVAPYVPQPLPPIQSALLPPNERRRAPLAVQMVLCACADAMKDATVPAAELASVFATSDADMAIVHRICSALATSGCSVSPTDFHNSVHNAAAGYWSLASSARRASTTLAAHDFSFPAGLREALATVAVDDVDVLLALYDVPPPPPLYATRPISQPAAVALVLTRRPGTKTLGRISWCESEVESTLTDAGLEALRQSNPALRALPLLQAIAMRKSAIVGMRADNGGLSGIELQAP